jgi:hypothetical protein
MNVPSTIISPTSAVESAEARVARYDWNYLSDELGGFGCAVMEKLLSPEECRLIAGLYPEEGHFRSHIHMARHGFGKGEYRYFRYPLPDLLGGLRTALYPRLAGVANDWNSRMGFDECYPAEHAAFSSSVTIKAKRARRPCCCNTSPATSTAFIRISTATSHSRSRWRSFSPSRGRISPAASSS